MSVFEYIMVLVSIIVGLGITHIIKNIVFQLQQNDVRFYWVHFLWCLNIFFVLIFFWWWQYNYVAIDEWTFGLYLFIVFFALLYFILASFLFSSKEIKSYKDHFYGNRKWFFSLLALSIIVDYGDTALKGFEYFLNRGTTYHIGVFIFTSLSIYASRSNNERYHAFFAVTYLSYQLFDGFFSFDLLQLSKSSNLGM